MVMDEETRWNILMLRNHAPMVVVPPLRIEGCTWNADRQLEGLRGLATAEIAYHLAGAHPRSYPAWPLDEIMGELESGGVV